MIETSCKYHFNNKSLAVSVVELIGIATELSMYV